MWNEKIIFIVIIFTIISYNNLCNFNYLCNFFYYYYFLLIISVGMFVNKNFKMEYLLKMTEYGICAIKCNGVDIFKLK